MNNLRPLPFALELNPQETAAAPAPGRRRLQRRAPAPLALEQRVMFDGATVDAVVRVAAPAAPAADNAPAGEGERSMVPVALAPAARSVQAEAKREVVFIEDNLPDYLKLAQGARAGAEVVVLDHTRDGLQQMIEALQGRQVDAIHLVTHGANGQVDLGSSRLSVSNVDAMAGQLARLGQSLSADGDLLLYGCDVAGGAGGDFLARLAQHTGADVAASSDTTGSRGFGNWTLEAQDGSIETAAMALDDAGWQGAMVTTVFDAQQRQLVFKGAVAESANATGKLDGEKMRFTNVITIDGQAIDAIVTTTLSSATISDYDSLTAPGKDAEAAAFFQPNMSVKAAGGNATFQFDFVLAGTTTAVTLQNFVVNSYDIDSTGGADRQFQEFKGFSRYEVSKTTQLVTDVRADGSVRFEYSSTTPTNYQGTLYHDPYRVQVYYDSASSIQIRSGANAYNNGSFGSSGATAYFSLEFKIRPWEGETVNVGTPAANLGYGDTVFKEAAANDGSIDASTTITLANGKFTGTNGEPLPGVTFTKLPAGLSATVTRLSDTTATLSFTGSASAHANANDVANFGISFGNASFASGNAGAVTGAARSDLVIDFQDPDNTAPLVQAAQNFSYAENRAADAVIGTVRASDAVGVKAFRFADSQSGESADGRFAIDANGTIRLTEAGTRGFSNDFELLPNGLTYAVQAGDAAGNWSVAQNVTLNVTNIDEAAPAFTSASRATVNENQKLLYTAQATDSADATDGAVRYALAEGGDAALLKIDGVTGAVTLAEGALDFEAKASYGFTVIATDASGNAIEQAVTVEVNNLDDHAPVFTSVSSATVSENQGLLYTAQAQDSTDYTDKAVAYALAAGGDAALLQIDGKTGAVRLAEGTLDFETKDRYSFTVVATDASGNASRQAVTVDVANIDEVAPAFASGATVTVDENQDLLYTAQAADEVDFTDRKVTYALAAGGDAALLRIDGVTGAVTLASGKLDFEARPRYSFTVLASDASGNTRAQAVVADVADLNEAPVGADASASTDEDTQLRGQLPAYQDQDGNPATYLGVTAPQHGSVDIAPDGSYTYTPARDFHGADSFTYAIDDGHGGKNTYRVDITVNPVNDAPVAGAAQIRTSEDTAVNGQLPAAVDAEGDPVAYSVETGPAKGELVLGSDGKYTYTPHANANGADSFTYRVGDGKDSTLHKVDIVIDAVNDAPVAADAAIVTSEDKTYAGQLPGARDVDGDPVRYALEGAPAHGQVTIGPDGRYVYTPAPDFNGSDRFTYRVSDGQGGVGVHTVSITVQAVNDAPTAGDAAFVTREDEAHAGKLPAATDIDRDPVTYALAEQALHGSVGIKADGSYVYTPAADYNGADRFRYTVSDGQGGSNTYTVEIDVTPVNDAPVASPVVAGAARLGEPMAPVRVAPFTDIDSTALTYGATLAGGGALPSWLAFDPATLSFTGTPPGGALGTLDIVVTGSDGQLSATTTVTIAVGNPAAPTQTATIDLMTRDTGSFANDFITADGAAGRGVSGTLDAPLGRNEVLQVSFDGGASWTEATVDGGRWQAIDGGAHDAGWTIVTRVTNTVAGLSGLETTRAVTLDRDAPVAPTVGNIDTGSTTPVLGGTATVLPGETLHVEVNGQGYIVPVQDGRWTLDLATASPAAQLVEGRSYDVVATVVDSAGNSRGDAGVVRISAPVVPQQPVVIVPAAAPVAPVIAAEPAPAPAAAPVALPPLRESAVPGSVVGGDATLLSTGSGTRTASMEFANVLRGAELSDVYTRSEGFRTVVAKAEEPALLRFQGVPDQFVDSGARLSLTIPSDAFAHTQPKAIVRLAAALQDGRPLPNWVQFNGQTGQFTGEVPKGLAGELKIKLIARDLNGREAVALFRINVGEVDAKGAKDGKGAKADAAATGKPGLSERMKAAQGARAAALPGRP